MKAVEQGWRNIKIKSTSTRLLTQIRKFIKIATDLFSMSFLYGSLSNLALGNCLDKKWSTSWKLRSQKSTIRWAELCLCISIFSEIADPRPGPRRRGVYDLSYIVRNLAPLSNFLDYVVVSMKKGCSEATRWWFQVGRIQPKYTKDRIQIKGIFYFNHIHDNPHLEEEQNLVVHKKLLQKSGRANLKVSKLIWYKLAEVLIKCGVFNIRIELRCLHAKRSLDLKVGNFSLHEKCVCQRQEQF